jgi:hydrogenase maturation protease
MRNKTAVIGLGNWLLSDEGAGLHAIELLKKKFIDKDIDENIEVDLVDAGTPGMNLLHQFDEREKIIFIDAGNCGLEPGAYRRFIPDEVISLKKTNNFSLHEFDLIAFLEFAKQLDFTKNTELVIYCMQAAEITMSEELSMVAREKLPYLVDDVYNELRNRR